MGKNNRQRRAAKQRQRRREGAAGRSGPRPAGFQFADPFGQDRAAVAAAVELTLLAAADCHQGGESTAARDCVGALTGPAAPFGSAIVAQVVEELLRAMVEAAVLGGWQPRDLQQITNRRLGPAHQPVVAAMVASHTYGVAPGTVHPRWLAQLAGHGADEGKDGVTGFARRRGLDVTEALILAVELVGLLRALPQVPPVLPVPGRYAGAGVELTDDQTRLLVRVRALLAKAESTEFDEEAEALTAKAQALMTRHSLEHLLASHVSDTPDPNATARLWLDPPYASAKSLVVSVVAEANRCRAVWSEGLGFVTLLGPEPDLVAVELLATSLLVQATRAMVHAQPSTPARTRSFRRSFIVAFATRIGERLRGAADGVGDELSDADPGRLLPVLRAASERLEATFTAMFPDTVLRTVNVSNGVGWAAGRAAADLALLDVYGQLTAAGDPSLVESA